ncbi:MAG: hypothetical protein EBS39_11180 [Gammaproteobacteria bacterium]|nr:hypothetical protein [Gammaproteobacteria bacterium]
MPPIPDEAAITARLGAFVEPNLRQSLAESRALRGCSLDAGATPPRLRVALELGIPTGGYHEELAAALTGHLAPLYADAPAAMPVLEVGANRFTEMTRAIVAQELHQPRPGTATVRSADQLAGVGLIGVGLIAPVPKGSVVHALRNRHRHTASEKRKSKLQPPGNHRPASLRRR